MKRHYVWHPFTFVKGEFSEISSERFHKIYNCFVEGNGLYLYDLEGKKYLNTCSSLWNVNFGLGQKRIIKAALDQLNRLSFHPLFRSSHSSAEDYARELVKFMPKNLEVVFFSNSGSEAVECAVKATRQYFNCLGYKDKKKIVYLKGAYHGVTYGSLSCSDKKGYEVYSPFLPGFEKIPNPYCYRCPLKESVHKCDLRCALELSRLISKIGKDKLAAIIVEPIQGEAGIIYPPKGYLEKILEICKENNLLLIFDEVTTGFGRTGYPFAFNLFNIRPDIICLSKGINGGYLPMGVTVFSKEIFNSISKKDQVFLHGSTQAGNPINCAIASIVLEFLKNKKFLNKIKVNAELFEETVNNELKPVKIVGDIRGKGFMIGVELVKNRKKKSRLSEKEQLLLEKKFSQNGLFTYMNNSTLYLMPPIIISRKKINEFVKIIKETLISFQNEKEN